MLYFSHVNAIKLFQSFFTSFFICLCRICLRAKVRSLVFIICLLLEGIDCVTDKLKPTFSSMKHMLFHPQIWSTERWKSHFRAWNFTIFWDTTPPQGLPPAPKKGTNGLWLTQSLNLFKPGSYFKFYWNPWDTIP